MKDLAKLYNIRKKRSERTARGFSENDQSVKSPIGMEQDFTVQIGTHRWDHVKDGVDIPENNNKHV